MYEKTLKRRDTVIDDSVAVLGRRICEDFCETRRKSQKHREMDETDQEIISVPRRIAYQEDTACDIRADMSFAVVDLERTCNTAPEIMLNTYHEK